MRDDGVLSIVECGDPVLRAGAGPVDPDEVTSERIQRLITQMRTTMEQAPGVGLAAPQVGVPLAVAVLADGPERWGATSPEELASKERTELPFTVLVNPVLIGHEDTAAFYEACLSVPGLTGLVVRHRQVTIEALDQEGQPFRATYHGWPARIVQHEMDHLSGTLYLDRVVTRSISTAYNYAERWAGHPPRVAAESLGFTLEGGS